MSVKLCLSVCEYNLTSFLTLSDNVMLVSGQV